MWNKEYSGTRTEIEVAMRADKDLHHVARQTLLYTLCNMVGTRFVIATQGFGPANGVCKHEFTITGFGAGT
jgi:hypothetical protein